MSGDVQPRKRKDKRKKRDDRKSEGDVSVLRQPSFQDDDDTASHGVHLTKMGNDDIHLHVQHQHGTGGHWCAKVIFFALMAVLLGLVGLIIMENRGMEDLDTPLSESRYSNYFDGWVEEHRHEDEHDEHGAHEAAIDEHDDEHDEEEEEEAEYELQSGEAEHEAEEEHEEDADEDEEDNNAAENVTAEDDELEKEEDDDAEESIQEPEPTQEDEQDEDAADDDDEEDEDADDEVEESIEPPVSQSRTQSAPETVEDEEEDNEIDEEDDDDVNEEEEEEFEEESTLAQSQAQSTPDNADDDDDEDENDDTFDEDEEQIEESAEPADQSKPDTADDADDDADDLDQADNDEDDFESLDQETDNEAVKEQTKEEQNNADTDNEEPASTASWLGSLAVKFGVGIALAFVLRFVLLRKNPNTNEDDPMPEANLRRRLTIASAEDNIPDDVEELPPLDDDVEYSEEEIEIEEEIEVEITDEEVSEDEEERRYREDLNSIKTFEQFNALYKPTEQPKPNKTVQEPKIEPVSEIRTFKEPEAKPHKEPETEPTDIYEDGDIEDYEHDESDEEEEGEEEEEEEEEYSDEKEDEVSDVDDAELMSRLEAKYGRLPAKEFETDSDSDDPTWTQIKPKEKTGAQSTEDLFEQELRKANAEMINEQHAKALRAFNQLTHTYAHMPAAHLGLAQTLERLAELRRSNQFLLDAVESYKRYLAFAELVTNNTEYRAAGERCIKHLRFLGYAHQAVAIHELLIERFPAAAWPRNQLSLTYLMLNNLAKLEEVASATLQSFPRNPVAHLHLGLALKQLHGDYAKAVYHLEFAINSQAAGTQEAFFYLALGESLQRLRRQEQALQVYALGVQRGFFDSVYQRSLYNVPKLRAKPFWLPEETSYSHELKQLQSNWRSIRKEALALLNIEGQFINEAEQLRDTGNWQQFELFAQGRRRQRNCQRAPVTCALIDKFPAASGCRRGQVKFSAMRANTHVWPHCGPTNCRLRAHLTLLAPEPHLTSLRVAEQERTWLAGDLFIFDDSIEHEVWHNGTELRLVLILDFWHPDLSESQRRSLTPI